MARLISSHRWPMCVGFVVVTAGLAVVLFAAVGSNGTAHHDVATVAPFGPPVNRATHAVGQSAFGPATTPPPPSSTTPAVTATTGPKAPALVTTRPTTAATVPPARPKADPVTDPPTTAPATTVAPPTTTPAVTTAAVSLVNSFSGAVKVSVGGQAYTLAPGQVVGPIAVVPAASGNDIISVGEVANPTCGVGDAQKYFYAGLSYQVQITVGTGQCLGASAPGFQVVQGLQKTG
jgi:hypothetical protein